MKQWGKPQTPPQKGPGPWAPFAGTPSLGTLAPSLSQGRVDHSEMVSLGQEEVAFPSWCWWSPQSLGSAGHCGDGPKGSWHLLGCPWDPRPLTRPLLSCSSWPPTGTTPREPGLSPKYPPSTTGPRPPTASEYKGALSGPWSTALGGSQMAPGGPSRVGSWVPPTGSGRSQPQLRPPHPEVPPVSAGHHRASVLGRGAPGWGWEGHSASVAAAHPGSLGPWGSRVDLRGPPKCFWRSGRGTGGAAVVRGLPWLLRAGADVGTGGRLGKPETQSSEHPGIGRLWRERE